LEEYTLIDLAKADPETDRQCDKRMLEGIWTIDEESIHAMPADEDDKFLQENLKFDQNVEQLQKKVEALIYSE